MDIGIGATLREARIRRKVDLSEVEAATQIRIRYLRAIESEDWDVLPGDVYVRSFIRTYAAYLGLDGERLADEYRRSVAAARSERPTAGLGTGAASPSRARGRAVTAAVVAALVAATVAIGLVTGDEDPTVTVVDERRGTATSKDTSSPPPAPARQPGLSLELAATAEVWVCLLDERGEPLVDGQLLVEGAEEGPFRSGSFTVSFGNGEVSMKIDGKETDIPETSSPVGYAIGDGGTLEPLGDGERPTCL